MQTVPQLPTLLLEPEQHPLLPPETVRTLGSVIVVAPHPDDESLGCGGLLALLGNARSNVHVVVMTDGSRSHPHSTSYPTVRLAALREQETLDALSALGLATSSARFLRYPDCGLPSAGAPAFGKATERLHRLLVALAPDTVLLPWRRDPHCDHEATWTLWRTAFDRLRKQPRWLEYPIWAWTRAGSDVAPKANEGSAWRLDISSVLARKERAIAQHRSQIGGLIDDDPDGFCLDPVMLAHFARPWELFIEPADV